MQLATAFYTRVFDDEQVWFREIFDGIKKADAIQNQYEWLVQRLGGPALFTNRKGHPGLMRRHNTFAVTEASAERWLEHMEAAVTEVTAIDGDSAMRLKFFFRHMAFFLAEGLSKPGGPGCPHIAAHAAARSAALSQQQQQNEGMTSDAIDEKMIADKIRAAKAALFTELSPETLDVTWVDDAESSTAEDLDSSANGIPARGHFEVLVVLARFDGMLRLERQRTVLQVVARHLDDCAISVLAKTPSQWERWVLSGSWQGVSDTQN